jgi:hypothetical protein
MTVIGSMMRVALNCAAPVTNAMIPRWRSIVRMCSRTQTIQPMKRLTKTAVTAEGGNTDMDLFTKMLICWMFFGGLIVYFILTAKTTIAGFVSGIFVLMIAAVFFTLVIEAYHYGI